MTAPHLSIGTATSRINLLSPGGGFCLNGWNVGDTELDAIFQESQLADYRQMAAYRDITTVETFGLILSANTQDLAARELQAMRVMIRLIADYWTTTWQTSVVYLQARASCESNLRYAVCHDARLVGESNPFGQPFVQPMGGVVMDALSLIVERGPWLADQPGTTGTCVEISSQGPSRDVYALSFDATDDDVNCGSGASIDDLPDSGFTFEAWIKADGWGENNVGRIVDKGTVNLRGWSVYVHPFANVGLEAYAYCGTTDAKASVGLDEFTIDGQWHHIVAWFDENLPTWGGWGIAIDGHWVESYSQFSIGSGAYASDAADDLILGNNSAGTRTWDGSIGWVRITDGDRYTYNSDFTPPDRCVCPADDADTISLWCLSEGAGATAYDENANSNDGTITGAAWEFTGCTEEYMEATCEAQSVFVANKHNVAQITHCYYWDDTAAQWTDGGAPPNNLIGDATPYAFLPAAPAADDFVIFGISTTLADSGPFSSLIFDIGTAIGIGTGITIQWRYKATGDADDPGDGVNPWSALTVQDNTNQYGAMTGDPFDTEGIWSVHWEQPSDWETSNPNPGAALGVTGYWVCAYITNVAGGVPTPPTQDNRDIYTVTWPYIEFEASEVSGDMPALSRVSVDTRSAQDGVGTTTDLWCQRVIAGLRSMDRGERFSSYINISDEQNDPAITITLDAGMGAFGTVVTAPTGIASLYTAAGVDAMATRVLMHIPPDYYGRFHAFVRGKQTGGAGNIDVRLAYAAADTFLPTTYTVTRQFLNTNDDQLLDMGEIVLGPAAEIYPLEVSGTFLLLQAGTDGAATAYFYDVVLIPVDEWAVDSEDVYKNAGDRGYTNDYWSHLEIDGIRNPRNLLSYLIGNASGKIARYWRPITNGLPILQTGKQQRLWFLMARCDDYADADDIRADSEICSSVQIWKNQRYTTLRGDQ